MLSLGGDDYQCDGESEHPKQQNRTNDHWSREQTSTSPTRRWHWPKETILKNKVFTHFHLRQVSPWYPPIHLRRPSCGRPWWTFRVHLTTGSTWLWVHPRNAVLRLHVCVWAQSDTHATWALCPALWDNTSALGGQPGVRKPQKIEKWPPWGLR